MTAPTHPAYRPAIDGLRAIAILSVLGFHAFPAWVPGGFVGVDIFFVISGFLISGIVLNALQAGRFSLMDFYARRVRRIFPALLLVLAAVLAFGFFILWPGEYRHLGQHSAGGAGFVANLQLAQESGYFQDRAESKPVLHLWSLGVEEQFYIFWPLLLALAWRCKHHAGAMIALGIAASFAANIWLAERDAIVDFYSPLSRFWELLAGGALAWGVKHHAHIKARSAREACAVIGLVLIVAAVFALNKDIVFPGWWALLPVGGAVALIAAGEDSFVNRKILAQPAVVGIGLISYPLYLWHWPLLSYAHIAAGQDASRGTRMAMVALAFALAALTYRFIERPVRAGALNKKIVLALAFGMALTGGVGAAIYARDGLPQRFADAQAVRALDTDRLIDDWQTAVRIDTCHLQDVEKDRQMPECIEATRPLLFLWGDSHAATLYPGLKKLQQDHAFGLAQLTQAGCPPLVDIENLVYRKNCNAINARILDQIQTLQPAIVMLDSAWIHDDYPMNQDAILTKLTATLARIHQAAPHSKVIVMGPLPRWQSPLPAFYRRALSFGGSMPPARRIDASDTSIVALDQAMRAAATQNNALYLSPRSILCDASGCLTRLGAGMDSIAYIDAEHLTPDAAVFLIDHMADAIIPLLRR